MTLENILSKLPKSVRAMGLALALPVLSYGQTLKPTASAVTSAPLTGVATTSSSVLGASSSALFTYNVGLTSGSGSAALGTGITDLGSWNDSFYLTLDNLGSVSQRNVSNNNPIGLGMSLPSGTLAISKEFNYNGNPSLFAVASNGDVNLYNFSTGAKINATPIFNASSSVNGLDVRVYNTPDGYVSNIGQQIEFFTTTTSSAINYTSGTGTTLGNFGVDSFSSSKFFTDITYDNGTIYLSFDNSSAFNKGGLIEIDFSGYQTNTVPEPATTAAIAGLVVLGAAGIIRRRQMKNVTPGASSEYKPVATGTPKTSTNIVDCVQDSTTGMYLPK